MKIPEILFQEPSSFESSEEENMNNLMKAVTPLFNPILKSSLLLTPVGSFLLLAAEQVPIKTAAADTGISLSLACRLIKLWEEREHNSPKYAPVALDQMRHRLLIEFRNLTVKKTTSYNHRNSEEAKLQRKATVLAWVSGKGMCFEKSCVPFDNGGFNLHVNRSRSWSKKGGPVKSIVPTSRGTSIAVFEAIFHKEESASP
ncbi:hypothetical protein G6F22_010077 [Rhizopus arrhizus]|uniref:Uncharacterized protein n=1 Tax=Rhizopus oryzae TaxID=64495 RepID=A0A9P6X1S1_RHIOR|nr:hypothetical protein G6F23_008309 [Rhizopus arrhizus]KAG0780453.1 hypothetical protein G6F22_010077 [Rhizopus arrhizus]KAG0783825.1 hypothetical protein G6F21_010297 [Rhizopus arrhizus]KAG0912833.1 hypothetical protein G6F33_005716 [Rhizopus arrhizus]KAG1119809.1 hypothetical protein G6F42_012888 [Rhizopus arrhizus]